MRKASRLLSSMWDRQGRWFMPGLSLAALAKYGEGFDPVVVRRARSWAHERQNLDGGWSWCPEGQFLDTALTVGCLGDLAGQQVQTSISRAATWIRARRSPERGWGQHIAAPPDADDTGAAVLALVAAGSDGNDTDVCDALDFLCRSQNRNGSWGYPRHVGANLSEDTAAATAALMISSTQRHRLAAQPPTTRRLVGDPVVRTASDCLLEGGAGIPCRRDEPRCWSLSRSPHLPSAAGMIAS